jgi:hypothetical protein
MKRLLLTALILISLLPVEALADRSPKADGDSSRSGFT